MDRLTVFLCHAETDGPLAGDLAAFLERGAGVEPLLAEGRLGPGETLLSRLPWGFQADVVLALLSPASVVSRWRREEWTPVFHDEPEGANVKVACVLLQECDFPPLLRRSRFFDLPADRLEGFRSIKRWLLRLQPLPPELFYAPSPPPAFSGRERQLEALRTQLADSPGVATLHSPSPGCGKTALAAEFARRCKDDFRGVFWVDCGSRSAARVAGELAAQIGLRLEGEIAANQIELRRAIARQRCLLIFDDLRSDVATPLLLPSGLASVLTTSERPDLPGARIELDPPPGGPFSPPPGITMSPDAAQALYRLPEARIGDLEPALEWALSRQDDPEAWRLACGLARRIVTLAKDPGRLAEADEFLQMWLAAAERRDDRAILDECAWERIWILEKWDRGDEARRLDHYRRLRRQDQMCFDFISA